MGLSIISSSFAESIRTLPAKWSRVLGPGPPEIIIDAFLFPSNSGGPGLLETSSENCFGSGITEQDIPGENRLIGLVSRTLQYSEEARSPQTGRTRVILRRILDLRS